MDNKPIINTVINGMSQDSLISLQPNTTARYMLNMTLGDRKNKGYGTALEEANEELHDYEQTIVGGRYIESLDAIVIFLQNGEIHLFDLIKRTNEFVASDTEFGCDWGFGTCEWITPDFKTDQPCNELKIYWSSNCEYYVLNLAEMLNRDRKEGLKKVIAEAKDNKSCGYTCEYFKLMKCVCAPNITTISSDKGGYKLVNGSYQFAVQLVDNGGNETNWSYVSNPISVSSESNIAGEMSTSSIRIHISGLDCRYDKVRIAVVKSVDGVMVAEVIEEGMGYNTNGITYTYTGQNGRFISLGEIKSKRKTYIKGRELISKDSRLWLYGIKQEKNLKLQERVLNEATVRLPVYKTTPEMVKKYGFQSLERGENYMFGIVYNYCDGTHSAVMPLKYNLGGSIGEVEDEGRPVIPPTGEGQKVERPRGSAAAEGGIYGCPGGNCGGGFTEANPRSTGANPGDGVLDKVKTWDTDLNDLANSANCDDCAPPHCCDDMGNITYDTTFDGCVGCDEDNEAIVADGPKVEDIFANHTDELADWNQDKDPNYTNGTLKTAAEKLIDSVDNSEFKVIKKDNFNIDNSVTGIGGGGDEEVAAGGGGGDEVKSVRSDDYTYAEGGTLVDSEPKLTGYLFPEEHLSEYLYPDILDCSGGYLYGKYANTNISMIKVPNYDSIVTTHKMGVPAPYVNTDPLNSVSINLVGLEVGSVPMPTADELSKPLCPNNPWSVVYVPRDEFNTTVKAKGHFSGMFDHDGVSYVRHGANSNHYIDRWVENGGSRLATGGVGRGHAFYSLDCQIGKIGLDCDVVELTSKVIGTGFRYGLYEKGQEPKDGFNGRRVDQRGARQAISLNSFYSDNVSSSVRAVGYVPSNRKIAIPNASTMISSMHRESFVYVESNAGLFTETDLSFTTDTLNHSCPIGESFMYYGALIKNNPKQYGALEGMSFIKTGLEGRGFIDNYNGVIGDVFIGPHTFIKKAYVSDKVGNSYPTPDRDRTVCDSPNDTLLQAMGLDWYPTQLPISGDRSDAKNWAGGHQDTPWDIAAGTNPTYDYYYPKLVKTLIYTFTESKYNMYLRSVGEAADQSEIGQVIAENLKNLHLDSNSSKDKHPYEKSFINRFYYRVEQPSVKQLNTKFLYKTFIYAVLPVLGLTAGLDFDSLMDSVKTLYAFPLVTAYWYMAKKLLTREDYLDRMLGMPICKTDASGGETDNSIDQFEDNYYAYNYDHNKINRENIFQAATINYNTCSCDKCLEGETTNEVFYSNKQVQGSQIDFYKQFGALSYLDINADHGKLTKLFVQNGDFFAHTTDGIAPIKYKQMGETSAGMARNGGELMFDPVFLLEGVNEGFAGLTDPNGAINTVYGYMWIDRPSRRLYVFDGNAPTPLSGIGLDKFFKNYINFCEVSKCHDEKNEEGTYYSLGYDPVFNRVLVTKKELDEKHSFTIGIDLGGKEPTWDGFHSYIPQSYIWDRSDLFTTKKGKIYLQNANNGKYRTFYEKEYPSEVEVVAVMNGLNSFAYRDSVLNTEAEKGGVLDLDETFNKIAVYNSSQGTGTMDVILFGDDRSGTKNKDVKRVPDMAPLKVTKQNRVFKFNDIKDRVKQDCKGQSLLIEDNCEPIIKIDESKFNCSPPNRQQFEGRVIADKYMVYRLTYDKDPEVLLRFLNINTDSIETKL